jgi:hypothetical protein
VEAVGTADKVLLEVDVKEVFGRVGATPALMLTAASGLEELPPALTCATLEFVAATPTLVDELILLTTVDAVASTLEGTSPTDEAGESAALTPTAMASDPDTTLKGLAEAVKLIALGVKRV